MMMLLILCSLPPEDIIQYLTSCPNSRSNAPPPPPSLQLGGGYGDYAAADSTEPVGNDAAPPVVLSAKAATAMPKLSAAEKAARQKRLAAREQALTVPPADSEPESEASSEEKFQAAQERVRRQRAIQHSQAHRGEGRRILQH